MATTVLHHLYGNPEFPSPPVPAATLKAATVGFIKARRACARGRSRMNLVKDFRRIAVISLLQTLAFHVQENCGGDPATLRATGFKLDRAAKQAHA